MAAGMPSKAAVVHLRRWRGQAWPSGVLVRQFGDNAMQPRTVACLHTMRAQTFPNTFTNQAVVTSFLNAL
jgi:hypothetical protein